MTVKPPRKSPSMEARQIDAVDRAIGARIRVRRLALQMTKIALGKATGVSFQQIQKYEQGSNRVAAGTLFKLAKALGVPVGYFYADMDQIVPIEAQIDIERLLSSAGGGGLAQDYLKLPEGKRRMVTSLAKSLAGEVAKEKKA